jgi:hypothetical protein
MRRHKDALMRSSPLLRAAPVRTEKSYALPLRPSAIHRLPCQAGLVTSTAGDPIGLVGRT